jgi:hypothetical protein
MSKRCYALSDCYCKDVCLRIKPFNNKNNPAAWVRERTMPTERPPLVGEVSTNFWA